MTRPLVCALSGHRTLPPDFDRNALHDAIEFLIREGCDYFLCGMAQGFDLLALEEIAAFRRRYPHVQIEACIPFPGHEERLAPALRRQYEQLLSLCDRKTVVCDHYFAGCFLKRDAYMADCADVLLCYLREEQSGTGYTVRYAEKRGIRIIRL